MESYEGKDNMPKLEINSFSHSNSVNVRNAVNQIIIEMLYGSFLAMNPWGDSILKFLLGTTKTT